MVRKFAKNDEGVSAVIGVILMVAITVILAAVIAAFVFSMSNGVSKPYTVGVTIKKVSSGDIIITNNGGNDASSLEKVTITYQPKGQSTAITAYLDDISFKTVGTSLTIPKAGKVVIPSPAPTPVPSAIPLASTNHVIVTGTFTDGRVQVIGEADV